MNAKLTGLIAVVGALFGVLALWPQAQPFFDYAFTKVGLWLTLRQTQAVIMAVLFASAIAFLVPYYLPGKFKAEDARRRMSGYASALAWVIAWFMVTTLHGFMWGAIAAVISIVAPRIAWVIYGRLAPHNKPESLK